jgi:hypothetical protein
MAEDYVKPPILGVEAPSRAAAAWRFRLAMTVLVLLLAAAAILVVRAITGGGEGSGTVGLPAAAALSPVVTGTATR